MVERMPGTDRTGDGSPGRGRVTVYLERHLDNYH